MTISNTTSVPILTSNDITLAIVQKMGPTLELEYDCFGLDLAGAADDEETGAATVGGVFGGGGAPVSAARGKRD